MKKKHIITSGKRLVKKKIKLIKDGKPYHSNFITDWRPVDEEIIVKGKVREIYS